LIAIEISRRAAVMLFYDHQLRLCSRDFITLKGITT
jgi:hypothetical protein